MKIEYTQKNRLYWEATLNDQLLAVITCVTCVDGDQISIMDYRTKEFMTPDVIFESINQAKAAIEYHFRDLIQTAE